MPVPSRRPLFSTTALLRRTAWFAVFCTPCLALATPAQLPNPIVFVTQVPIPADFSSVTAVIGGQQADMAGAGRGGDLWIRYPDGTLRNLTAEAGYGNDGLQGANAIGVRDPAVDWTGTKVLFSMVVGAPQQYQWIDWHWQLYEATGIGEGQTLHIALVPNQPAQANNIQGTYASDGSIVFVSDQSRNNQAYLFPQLDEYESVPTATGLWKLNPTGNAPAVILEHAPSGASNPFIDTYGRIIFTRWDHLQRDQQADAGTHGAFNWSSEDPNAVPLDTDVEVFPEPRTSDGVTNGFTINQFFPWSMNQDGTVEETVNHIGRHELFKYFSYSLLADSNNLIDFEAPDNRNYAENWLQMSEDPLVPGRYVAIEAQEFYTHGSGQIIALTAPLGTPADQLAPPEYLTPFSTRDIWDNNPPADFTGHYRNAVPLSDGSMICAYAAQAGEADNLGSPTNPIANYMFRLYMLASVGGYMRTAGDPVTGAGITKSVSYYNPDILVSYSGPLWELSPVEVRARTTPPMTAASMQAPETQAFAQAGVDASEFQNFLAARGLAVLVSRNVTSRDDADCQQPYNLRVPNGVETVGSLQLPSCSADPNLHPDGTVYDISYMQFFEGDLIRGYGGTTDPQPGRRVLAQPLHDAGALQFMPPPPSGAPAGSVAIAADGSAAAIVPAQRAMAWQTTSPDGTPVVRERYWISAKPGEVRACDSCHGTNSLNQAGQPAPQNVPQALVDLVSYWRDHHDSVFASGFDG